MKPEEYWTIYAPDLGPADLITRYESRDPRRCAMHYANELGDVFGIVRRGTWNETFAQDVQISKEALIEGLTAHLEETRETWEESVRAYDEARRAERAAAAEAAALAAEAAETTESAEATEAPAETSESEAPSEIPEESSSEIEDARADSEAGQSPPYSG